MMGEVNYLALIAVAVVNMVLGTIWYSQAVFGKQWMRLMGISHQDMMEAKKKGGMTQRYVAGLISSVVMAYVLKMMLGAFGVVDANGAWKLAFWIWLGFLATSMLGSVLWERRPIKLYVINTLYYLVSLGVMGTILVWWS
jgi:hypothetical protein